jgi:hypothetical protein
MNGGNIIESSRRTMSRPHPFGDLVPVCGGVKDISITSAGTGRRDVENHLDLTVPTVILRTRVI